MKQLNDLAERALRSPIKRATCRLRDGTRVQAAAYCASNRAGLIVRFKLRGVFMYLGTNATPQERIERGEGHEVWPAVEALIEVAKEFDPEYIERLEGDLDHAEAVLHDIRKQLEYKPRLRKLFNQLLEAHGYEF